MSARHIEFSERNRFSTFVATSDMDGLKILKSWIAHFERYGIRAVLGRTVDGFAVYREGLVNQEFSSEE